jgi:N-methylhydantoinase B
VSAVDPVILAVLKGRLEGIADEMDATLYRSAFNPIIAEARDACHGLYHAETGDTLVQGAKGLPVFVGAMAFAVRTVIAKTVREGGPVPGDTFLFNDPYDGGTHLNDFRLVRPIFRERSCSAGSPPPATGSTSAATCRGATTPRPPKASRKACASRPSG